MSISSIMRIALLFFLIGTLPVMGQDRVEKESHRSSCFSGKIEITKTHVTSGQNGELSVDLPRNAGNVTLMWVVFGETKKGKEIKNLKTGYYNLLIIDNKNCQTVIDNIQIKETQ